MNAVAVSVIAVVAINAVSMVAFFIILRSRFSRDRLLGELRAEVDRLVMDLGREADRDVAVLESRIKNLRSLMDEADRRILVARKETSRRKEESDILQNIAFATGNGDVTESGDARSGNRVESQWVEPGETALSTAGSTVTSQAKSKAQTAQARTETASRIPNDDGPRVSDAEAVRIYTRPVISRSERQIEPFVPVQDRVLDMARRGFTAELISGTLSMPLGEVELILDMNRSSL
jgi:hypothetical protein